MDLQCAECRRIWLDFARAADELFTIHSNLQSARLAGDRLEVLRLSCGAEDQIRQRSRLRFEFDAHQAGAHSVAAQDTRIANNDGRYFTGGRKERSCYP